MLHMQIDIPILDNWFWRIPGKDVPPSREGRLEWVFDQWSKVDGYAQQGSYPEDAPEGESAERVSESRRSDERIATSG